MTTLVNTRVKITLNDSRSIVGQLLAYDKYMNLVVADAEEFRRVKSGKKVQEAAKDEQQVMRRSLGLLVLRGETIVSCSQETGAPSSGFENKTRTPASQHLQPGMRPTGAMPGAIPPPMPNAAMMMRPGMPPMMMPPGMMPPK
jgi:small nuclear ribonucleoprotein B and B'